MCHLQLGTCWGGWTLRFSPILFLTCIKKGKKKLLCLHPPRKVPENTWLEPAGENLDS